MGNRWSGPEPPESPELLFKLDSSEKFKQLGEQFNKREWWPHLVREYNKRALELQLEISEFGDRLPDRKMTEVDMAQYVEYVKGQHHAFLLDLLQQVEKHVAAEEVKLRAEKREWEETTQLLTTGQENKLELDVGGKRFVVDGTRFMGQQSLLGALVDWNSHQKRNRSDSDDNDDMTYSGGKRRKPSERADGDRGSDSDSALGPQANESSMVNINTLGGDQSQDRNFVDRDPETWEYILWEGKEVPHRAANTERAYAAMPALPVFTVSADLIWLNILKGLSDLMTPPYVYTCGSTHPYGFAVILHPDPDTTREYTNRYKMLGWVGWRRSLGPGLGSVDVFPSFAWYSLWDWVKRRERSKEITEQKNLTKTKFVYDYLDGNKSHHYLVLVSSSQDILGTNAKLQSFQTEWKRHIYLHWRFTKSGRRVRGARPKI